MSLKKNILLLLLCSLCMSAMAQTKADYSTKKKKAISLFEESELYLIRRQFPQAIKLLQEAISKDDDFAEAHLRLGSLLRDVGNIDKAIYHLKRAIQILPEDRRTSGANYALAEIYFKTSQYDKADDYLNDFLNTGQPDPRILTDAKKLQQNIRFSKEAIKNPLPFKPSLLSSPLNRSQLEYFPVLTADKKTIIFTRREGVAAQYDEDIMISRKNKAGDWQIPESISNTINTRDNEGTTAVSADGRMLIFTSCMGRKGYGSCDLFVSYKSGDEWSEPENLGANINSAAWESQPSLSADGRTLYFVSDRPGGSGKRDIWVSYFNGEDWSKAENLGTQINTADDDVSPFIHVNGQTLYFASKGLPGFGGYDIYAASLTDVGWTRPENLGYPLNNSADQVSLFITADGKEGFYSYEENYRTQNYMSKIFHFEVPEAIQVENKSNYVYGKVYNAETNQPIGAKIELYNIEEDTLISMVEADSVNGNYLMVLTEGAAYALYVSKPGFLFQSLSFDYGENENTEPIAIDIFLDPIKKGTKTTLKNIFFDTDKYALRNNSKTELDKIIKFLKSNENISVEISGHTDDVGNGSYNKKLSLDRAKAVYDYLLQNGVSAQQITYQGYGETQPLVPNNSEANRQENRRIEFQIL